MSTKKSPQINALSLLNDAKLGQMFYGLAHKRLGSSLILDSYDEYGRRVDDSLGAEVKRMDISMDLSHLNADDVEGFFKQMGIAVKIPKAGFDRISFDTNGDPSKNTSVKQFFDALEEMNGFVNGPMIYRKQDNSFPVFLGFRGNDDDAQLKVSLSQDVGRVQDQFRRFGIEMKAGEPYCSIKGGHAPTPADSLKFYDHKDAIFTATDHVNDQKLRRLLGRIDELDAAFKGRSAA